MVSAQGQSTISYCESSASCVTDIRRMNRVQTLQHLLKRRTQLVKQSRLAREDRVAAGRGGSQHAKQRVGRRIHFERVIRMVFLSEMAVLANIAAASDDGDMFGVFLVRISVLLER